MAIKYAFDKLQESDVKITPQRMAILEVLDDNQGKHLSAEQIFLMVKKRRPNIGMATVYRTLELFANLDILHKTSFDAGVFRYEFCDIDRHHHHHVICVECGDIVELEDDLLHPLEKEVEKRGFKVVDHSLIIYGKCPECQ
ncbi:MAG: Fur family transcriptional regulator [Syntrophothermaceae bacterium]